LTWRRTSDLGRDWTMVRVIIFREF
jgi:hypothetical protein